LKIAGIGCGLDIPGFVSLEDVLQNVQISCGAHQVSYSLGIKFPFFEVKWPGQMATHLHLMLRLRMSVAELLLPLYAFMAWRGIVLPFCSFMLEIRNVGDGFLEFTQKQSH